MLRPAAAAAGGPLWVSVDISLLALRAPCEFSAEGLAAIVLADVLATGMARLDEQRAVLTREQLAHLRKQLLGR